MSRKAAHGELGPRRLFAVPEICKPTTKNRELGEQLLHELSLVQGDPGEVLRRAAHSCMRATPPEDIGVKIMGLAISTYDLIDPKNKTGMDDVYLACVLGDPRLVEDAFSALEKEYLSLVESVEQDFQSIQNLYSASILLTQAFPDPVRLGTVANIALLRSAFNSMDGSFNAYVSLWDLSLELKSDDGAILHDGFYESLFGVFKNIHGEVYPRSRWKDHCEQGELSAKDFPKLVKRTVRGKNIGKAAFFAAAQPQQMTLGI